MINVNIIKRYEVIIYGTSLSFLYSILNSILMSIIDMLNAIIISSSLFLVLTIIIFNNKKISRTAIFYSGVKSNFLRLLFFGGSIGTIYSLVNWPNVACGAKDLNNFFNIKTVLFPLFSIFKYYGLVLAIQSTIEEILNRGLILGGLLKLQFGSTQAIVISSLLFSLMHVNYLFHMQLYNFFSVFIFGLLCSYIVFQKRNILITIIIHYFFNVTTYILPDLLCGK